MKFFCELDFDPFVYMAEHNKRYSFTMSLKELKLTVPSLWSSVKSESFISDMTPELTSAQILLLRIVNTSPKIILSSFYPTMEVPITTSATVSSYVFHHVRCLTLPVLPVWSNFEIADLDFFRTPAYAAFFEHLDATGNFYYERWGDAPVHSIAVALFLPKEQIHFFHDIGYRHAPFQHCPQGDAHERGKCDCKWYENYGARFIIVAESC